MVTACLTLCLGLTLSQPPRDEVPPDVRFLPKRTVKFPLAAALPAGIRELRLYQSTDLGKTWTQTGAKVAKDAGQDCFILTVDNDGQYWFQVATVDNSGRQDPEDLYEAAKHRKVQKLIIQTKRPFVQIKSAQRHGDEIRVAWEVLDDVYLDWATFKLEYQIQPSEQWMAVPATPGLTGHAKFQPVSQGAVKVRVSLRNRAQTEAFDLAEVAGPSGPVAQAGGQNGSLNQTGGTAFPTPPDILGPSENKLPSPPPDAYGSNPGGNYFSPPPTSPADTPPPQQRPIARGASFAQEVPPPVDTRRAIGDSRDNDPMPAATAPMQTGRRPLPPIEYVNVKQITLEYELTRVGSSGVGSVEVWFTRNDGQTWSRYAEDPEAKGPGRHKRQLKLDYFGEGVVGFTLIVRSGAGLGRREPRPGDVPDKRIEIDLKPPEVKFFAPVPDPQRPNALLLNWIATDKNMEERPITLQWAEHREGPWFDIAANIHNSGRHSWQLPEGLPVQVYLRVCAVDRAGNKGIAATREPQLVDLSEPEGRLIGISVGPR